MSDLIINEPLAEWIRALARQQRRSPEDLLAAWVEHYDLESDPYNPPPRPLDSLTDDDIEVAPDVQNAEAYRAAVRAQRPKLYRIARRYWMRTSDLERLALTDEELDKVFWLIDHEGIPRFKSEKESIILPPDPLEGLIGTIDSDIPDLSVMTREYDNEHEQSHADHAG